MKGSTRSRDIVIPKGVCVCYPIIGGGLSAEGIDLGWCQEAKLSVAEEVKQIYSARDASRALAAERVTKRDYSLPLTLVSANAQNLALLFRGSKGSQIQAGGNYGVTALDITAPTELDRLKKLGKRGVSITRINYDGGDIGVQRRSDFVHRWFHRHHRLGGRNHGDGFAVRGQPVRIGVHRRRRPGRQRRHPRARRSKTES